MFNYSCYLLSELYLRTLSKRSLHIVPKRRKIKKQKCVYSTSVPLSCLFCAYRKAVFFLYYRVFSFLFFAHVHTTGANCLAEKRVTNNVLRKNTCGETPAHAFIDVTRARTTNSCECRIGKRSYVTAERVRCAACTKFQERTSYAVTTVLLSCVFCGP